MSNHPYADSEQLADCLGEMELIADKFSHGGLVLIRAVGPNAYDSSKIMPGWRAFPAKLPEEFLHSLESSLDKQAPPSYTRDGSRRDDLTMELMNLITEFLGVLPGYHPPDLLNKKLGR